MSEKNRILNIGYLPGRNGIATSVLNLYRHLDRDRFQYDFLISDTYRGTKSPDLDEILSMGAKLYFMDFDRHTFPESSHEELRELMLSIPDLRGVHVHDLNMMSYPLYLADQLGFPIKVIQCHTAYGKSKSGFGNQNPGFKDRLRLIEGDQFDRLACSDLAGLYDYHNLPYSILPNGVDTEKFSFNAVHRLVIRKKLGISEDSCVIGSVSNLGVPKNHKFSIRVFHRFLEKEPESHYIMLGGGAQGDEIKKYIEDNNLAEHVHMVGVQHEVDMFYSAMDILLHPSLSEGLPNTLVEAQATGIPCLISDQISDMARITPLVHALSLDAEIQTWVRKLRDIKNSHQERRSRGEEIKAVGYAIEDVAKRLMDIYDYRLKK